MSLKNDNLAKEEYLTKMAHPVKIFILLLTAIISLAGCTVSPSNPTPPPVETPGQAADQPAGPPDRVEVVYFYKSIPPPCECLAHAGENVKSTLANDFAGEIESGKLVFHYLASDHAQNAGMVKKYDPAPFSLWINIIRGYSEQIYSVDGIWEYLYDEPMFKQTVRAYVNNALKGQP
ncbi:MAG: hypothetical protein JW901_09980 [Dehalococcoidia bacterium]|nr:hypothetical protein [Dehalococcoidia bacterium]